MLDLKFLLTFIYCAFFLLTLFAKDSQAPSRMEIYFISIHYLDMNTIANNSEHEINADVNSIQWSVLG